MSIPLIIVAFNVTIVRDFLRTHVAEGLKENTSKLFRVTSQKWMSTISPGAWLPKVMDLIQQHSSLKNLPEPVGKWKERKKENLERWERSLRNKEKEIQRQAKLAQIEKDELAIYEDYDTSSEEEGKDGRTKDLEAEDGSNGESEASVGSDVDSDHSNKSAWRKLKGGARHGKVSLVQTLRRRNDEERKRWMRTLESNPTGYLHV